MFPSAEHLKDLEGNRSNLQKPPVVERMGVGSGGSDSQDGLGDCVLHNLSVGVTSHHHRVSSRFSQGASWTLSHHIPLE